MADSIYDYADAQRAALGTLERTANRRIGSAYQTLRSAATSDLGDFSARLAAWKASHPDQDLTQSPARHYAFQQLRYDDLIRQLDTNLRLYADITSGAIRDSQEAAMRQADAQGAALIGSALGDHRLSGAVSFGILPDDAIESVVGFASDGSPRDTLLRARSRDAGDAARSALTTAVGLGYGMNDLASTLDASLQQPHWKNLMLARTEMMRAYREAQRLNMLANADLLSGWRWSSAADERSCPICFSQHGRVFPINQLPVGQVPPDQAQHKGLRDAFGKASTASIDPALLPETKSPTPKSDAKRRAAIRAAEREHWASPMETATVIGPDGSVLLDRQGSGTAVPMPDDLTPYRGATLTHNHPGGFAYMTDFPGSGREMDAETMRSTLLTEAKRRIDDAAADPRWIGNSFSRDDVDMAVQMGLAEVRATTPRYAYSLKPAPGNDDFSTMTNLKTAMESANLAVRARFSDAIVRGTMTTQQASAEHWDAVLRQVAAETGVVYSREDVWEALT